MSFNQIFQGYSHKFKVKSNVLSIDFINYDGYCVGKIDLVLNQKEAMELIDILNNHKKW